MAGGQTLKTNGELDITRPDDILDLEIGELRIESEFLDDTRIFARRKAAIILRFCTSNHHLARRKDKSGGLRLTDAHDHRCETL